MRNRRCVIGPQRIFPNGGAESRSNVVVVDDGQGWWGVGTARDIVDNMPDLRRGRLTVAVAWAVR